jgi:hypothetical protein
MRGGSFLLFWAMQGADYSPKAALIEGQKRLIVPRHGDRR